MLSFCILEQEKAQQESLYIEKNDLQREREELQQRESELADKEKNIVEREGNLARDVEALHVKINDTRLENQAAQQRVCIRTLIILHIRINCVLI